MGLVLKEIILNLLLKSKITEKLYKILSVKQTISKLTRRHGSVSSKCDNSSLKFQNPDKYTDTSVVPALRQRDTRKNQETSSQLMGQLGYQSSFDKQETPLQRRRPGAVPEGVL